jgi:hypothetical protein
VTAIEREYQFLINRAIKENRHKLAEELQEAYDLWKWANPELVAVP